MSSEQSNIIKRQEQIKLWFESDTDKASNSVKEAEIIQFSKEVQFLSACNNDDWYEIERLLCDGIDINCTQDDGLTSLHQACIDDDEHLVRYLTDHGAEIDVQDKEGWTPLFAAISCNYLPITKFLIECGAKLDVVSFDGELPLDQSTNETMSSFIREQMKLRALDPDDIRNRERNTMLADIELMKKTQDFSKFTLVDNGGSLLHVAASKDYTDVMERLLEVLSPQQLNHTDKDGWNALHVAAHWGNKRACVLLVDADIDFDHVTSNNQTVLEVSDDDAKPYIREEIRKARFRRQDRSAIKRPAESPNAEYQRSEIKIACQEKNSPAAVDEIQQQQQSPQPQQLNFDKHVIASCDPVTESLGDNHTPTSTTIQSAESIKIVDGDLKSNTNEATQGAAKSHTESQTKSNIGKPESITNLPMDTSKPEIETVEPKLIVCKEIESAKPSATVLPSVKAVESESQRKDKARHVRSTRRSTQGVTVEDIDEAKKFMSTEKVDNSETSSLIPISTSNILDAHIQIANHNDDKDREHNSETCVTENVSPTIPPLIQITDSYPNGESAQTPLTAQNSDISSSVLKPESLDQADIKRKVGSHLVNKRKTRDRLPTGIVDLKDIQAAQKELVDVDKHTESLEIPQSREAVVDYKAMYEKELKEKEKLQRNLIRLRRDLEQSEDKIKSLLNNHAAVRSKMETSRNILSPDGETKSVERLRDENSKMKEANSALIRVISRLSHPCPKSLHNSS